jgi:hypothetical protein
MAGSSLPLAFGALLAGAIVIEYGVKNVRGTFSGTTDAQASTPGTPGAHKSGKPRSVHGFPASVNPLPGATISRLDQGIDGTGTTFLSPWAGKVEYATAHDSGWDGGGYIAIRSSEDPHKVFYLAEGITPVVHRGDNVDAGQNIAMPVSNPYNGIVGNIEAGLANPHNVRQPLAKVVQDAAGMVHEFAAWLHGLGVPKPTSTAMAGKP